jgi:hypothetical protein
VRFLRRLSPMPHAYTENQLIEQPAINLKRNALETLRHPYFLALGISCVASLLSYVDLYQLVTI